jgi:hypothetical protein
VAYNVKGLIREVAYNVKGLIRGVPLYDNSWSTHVPSSGLKYKLMSRRSSCVDESSPL